MRFHPLKKGPQTHQAHLIKLEVKKSQGVGVYNLLFVSTLFGLLISGMKSHPLNIFHKLTKLLLSPHKDGGEEVTVTVTECNLA
jgi:hypothetical protein